MSAEDFEQDSPSTGSNGSTTRVIIKNLPKYASTDLIKKHLSVRGYTITDLKLAMTKYNEKKSLSVFY